MRAHLFRGLENRFQDALRPAVVAPLVERRRQLEAALAVEGIAGDVPLEEHPVRAPVRRP